MRRIGNYRGMVLITHLPYDKAVPEGKRNCATKSAGIQPLWNVEHLDHRKHTVKDCIIAGLKYGSMLTEVGGRTPSPA